MDGGEAGSADLCQKPVPEAGCCPRGFPWSWGECVPPSLPPSTNTRMGREELEVLRRNASQTVGSTQLLGSSGSKGQG